MRWRDSEVPGAKKLARVSDADVARDVNDEIAFHLEESVAKLMARGMSETEARECAGKSFGDVAASRAELVAMDRRRRRRRRMATLLSGIGQDLRLAARSLRRSPGFSVAALVTLTVGIAVTTTMFVMIDGILLRPLPYAHPERLVGAWHDMPSINLYHTQQAAQTYLTYRSQARTIDGIAIYRESAANVSVVGQTTDPSRQAVAGCTASLFSVLGARALLGRAFSEADDQPTSPPVVVLSENYWQAQFGGDPRVLGKRLDVDGVLREIVGVLPREFQIPSSRIALWLPLRIDPANPPAEAFTYGGIARLKPGISIDAAQRDFASVLPRTPELFSQFVPGISMREIMDQTRPSPVLTPLARDITGGIDRLLWVLAGAALLLYLAACVNVGSLTLVRFSSRQQELALREALGGGAARVTAAFLAELLVLAFVSVGAAVVLSTGLIGVLKAAAPAEVPRLSELGLSWQTVLFALAAGTVALAACSIVPVARIVGGGLPSLARSRGSTTQREDRKIRQSLVAVQIAFALVVLTGAGLLIRSYGRLLAERPGFDAEHVETFWISLPKVRYAGDSAVARFYTRLVDDARALRGVQAAGVTSRLPLLSRGLNDNPMYVEGTSTTDTKLPPLQLFTTVGGEYFAALRIPLLAGRTFDPMSRQREGDAVVSSRTAALFWHDPAGRAAIGKRFRVLPTSNWYSVIGVVADAHDSSLATAPSPTVYFPQTVYTDAAQRQTKRTMALVVRSALPPAALTASLQRVVRAIDPSLPVFDAQPMSAMLRQSTARLRFVALLLAAAAAVATLLGAIGLYGVMAYVVALRRREIAVRIALGATPRSLAAATTTDAVRVTLVGLALGLALFAAAARVIRSLVFNVSTFDPVTLAGAVLGLIGIALVASWVPAQRSAHVDPAEALRGE
jgi:putative ABC transport system permease protein